MTPTQIALLVAGILALQLLVWVPLLLWVKRRTQRMLADLTAELVAAGERVVLGPAPAVYRGSTGPGFPRVKGNGVAALTDRRLVVRKLVGDGLEVPVADIVGVRDDKWFAGGYSGGKLVAVVKTRAGAEVGVMVGDHPAWMSALRAHARPE